MPPAPFAGSSLLSIFAFHLCISKLQRPRIARLFYSIQPSDLMSASVPSILQNRLILSFGHWLLPHKLRMFKLLQNISAHCCILYFPHIIFLSHIFIPYSIYPCHSAHSLYTLHFCNNKLMALPSLILQVPVRFVTAANTKLSYNFLFTTKLMLTVLHIFTAPKSSSFLPAHISTSTCRPLSPLKQIFKRLK